MPVAVTGEVIATRAAGPFTHLVLVAPGAAEEARPGQLVSFGVGGPDSTLTLRRTVPLTAADATGVYGGTVEVLLDPRHDAGLAWLAALAPRARVPLIAPVGRGFPTPAQAAACLVVGTGLPAAVVPWLTERLVGAGHPVRVMLADPADGPRLVAPLRRTAERVDLLTSSHADVRGVPDAPVAPARLRAAVEALLREHDIAVVYVAAEPDVAAAVCAAATQAGVVSQAAVDAPMPCGTGLCGGCSVPVRTDASSAGALVPACVHGPVLRGDRVDWDALGPGLGDLAGIRR